MKKSLLLMVGVLSVVIMSAWKINAVNDKTAIGMPVAAKFNWEQTVHDFGQIPKGTPVTHEFTFTNSGNEALVITTAKPSCGCTVTDYTKDPIPAGHAGFVKATYNAASVGAFTKTVTISANTGDEVVVLTIKGEVVE